jgi:hypothetical protein
MTNADLNTSPSSARPTPFQAAALVSRVVELVAVRLVTLSATGPKDISEFVSSEVRWKLGRPVSTYSFDEKKQTLDVLVSMIVVGTPGGSSKDRNAVRISGRISLSYLLNANAPPPDLQGPLFEGFARLNGVHNAWPYLRELMQSTSVRMGIPPVTIPTHRVVAPKPAKSRAQP